MPYTKTTWVDGENKYDIKTQSDMVLNSDIKFVYKGASGTPVSASNMNKIEQGIYDAHEPTYSTDATVTQELTTFPSTATKGTLDATLGGNTQTPYDQYTKLLMHFEGADTSTTFTDQTGKTVTPSGNAQIDTAQYRYGTSSGLFDGTGDYLTIADANNDLDIGTQDFCIETWVRFNSVTNEQNLFDFRTVSTEVAPLLYKDASHNIVYYVNGSRKITGTTTIAINTWYHIALSKNNGVTKLFVNGGQEGSNYSDANSYINVSTINIASSYTGTQTLNGWLDDLRISVGTPRYTSNFTPFPHSVLPTDRTRVKSVGKNLFDKYKITRGYFLGTTNSPSANIGRFYSEYIKIQPSTQYSISPVDATMLGSYSHWYDANKNWISKVTTATNPITSPSNAFYMRISQELYNLDIVQVEKASTPTTYEAYTETTSIAPVELKSVSSTIRDTFDANNGQHTKNTESDLDISSTQYDSQDTSTYTNVDVIKTTAFSSMKTPTTGVDGIALVINKDGKILEEVSQANIDLVASVGKYYVHTDKTIWFIVAADTYANIGDARTGLGTSKAIYQLSTPIVTNYMPHVLTAEPSGTIYVEPFISDVGLYGANIAIENTSYPIDSLDYVNRIDVATGALTPIALSSCTVATNGLTFTVSGATVAQYYDYGYTYKDLSTVPSLTYSYATNLKAQVNNNTNEIAQLDKKVDTVINNTDSNLLIINTKLERYGASSAGSDSYVVNNTYQTKAYYTGMVQQFKADVSNTGASTLNIDGLGAKTIKKFITSGKSDLITGDIISNGFYSVIYDGTDFILHNPNDLLNTVLSNTGDLVYASGNNVPARLAVGENGLQLVSDGSKPIYEYPFVFKFAPGDTVLLTANSERSVVNSTFPAYEKKFKLISGGKFRVKFEAKSSSGGVIRVAITNNAPNYLFSPGYTDVTSTSYSAYSIDTTVDLSDQDIIIVKLTSASSSTAYFKNVSICGIPSLTKNNVVQD